MGATQSQDSQENSGKKARKYTSKKDMLENYETLTTELVPWYYDHRLLFSSWKTEGFQSENLGGKCEELTILTYNVWFDAYLKEARFEALHSILQESNPDVICFQEVTQWFLNQLLNEQWIQAHYCVSDGTGYTFQTFYAVIILVKRSIPNTLIKPFTWHSLPSTMGRCLVVAHLKVNEIEISIGTIHMESLGPFQEFRMKQMDIIFPILSCSENALLLGDFNFGDRAVENTKIEENGFSDVWKVVHQDNPGSTMPENDRFPAWRPDRVVYSSNSHSMEPISIEIIGTNPLKQPGEPGYVPGMETCCPSDHYGLFCRFRLL